MCVSKRFGGRETRGSGVRFAHEEQLFKKELPTLAVFRTTTSNGNSVSLSGTLSLYLFLSLGKGKVGRNRRSENEYRDMSKQR